MIRLSENCAQRCTVTGRWIEQACEEISVMLGPMLASLDLLKCACVIWKVAGV